MSVAVKVCGLCREEDAAAAAAAGATYAGVILAPGLQRSRDEQQAAAILDAAGVQRVGVFVDAPVDDVLRAASRARLDVVQLHGRESPHDAAALRTAGVRVWKALRLRGGEDIAALAAPFLDVVDGVLLEGWSAAGHGGVGAAFDWQAAAPARRGLAGVQVIVAGGLNAGSVPRAVALLRPDVVDVSSGVEESPRRKSVDLLNEFIAAAHSAAAARVGSG